MGLPSSFITRCGIGTAAWVAGRLLMSGPAVASGGRLRRWVRLSAFGVLLAALAGCRALRSGPGSDALTQSDRLMACYPDLQTGRFTVIANFEQTRHMELFRSVSTKGTALHRLSLTSGVPASGGRCLRVAFSQPDDELTADGSETRRWSLPRDWREYDLLIMCVHTAAAVDLQLSLASGQGRLRSIADSRTPLRPGWNLLRLDLADAAEHVALDDIRELRWSLPAISRTTVLLLDDIILTNNQADMFGDSSADDGGLYVRRRGRRWDLGAAGRFELGLTNGQIKYWYDLTKDRLRVRNLVEGTVLGPNVVALTGHDDAGVVALDTFPAWGERIVARQRLLEATATRIVAECTWDFLPFEGDATADMPRQSWTYTLYPSGDLYIHIDCTTETATWTADRVGLAVSRRECENTDLVCHSTSQLGDTGRLLHVPYAWLRDGDSGGPGLLFAVHDGRSTPLMVCLRSPTLSRVTAVAYGGETRKPAQRWDSMLALGTPGAVGQPASRALHYCFPPSLSPSLGSLVTDSEGDLDHDGFNERSGCYVLAPDANRVLLTLDGTGSPFYSPAFLIQDSADREVWVYVDYVVLERVGRTAGGEVLFQLPGTVDTRRTVEVYLRNRPEGKPR